MRARTKARLPPTPRSQRPDRGVGGSLEAWSNWRGAGWPVGRRVKRVIGRSIEEEEQRRVEGVRLSDERGKRRSDRGRGREGKPDVDRASHREGQGADG